VTMSVSDTPVVERQKFNFSEALQRYGTFGIFIVLIVVATIWSDNFLSPRNIVNVLRQVAAGAGIMSVGMLFVILTAGIDLSVGSIEALGSVLIAYFISVSGFGAGGSVGLVILSGAVCGLVTGAFVAYVRLAPFVMSLAMMAIARGLSLIVSSGQPIPLGPGGDIIAAFGSGFLPLGAFSLPWPVVLMFIVFAVAAVVLNFTRFGRIVKAIGSNAEAVRLSGIPVARYVMAVYVISGALAAVAGIISSSRTTVGSSQVGVGMELNVIAAVVIGGASLMGGRGGVFNTFLGAMIMGIIGNIMNLAGVPGYHQQVYTGLIIIVAMLLQFGSTALRR
jgi:ribose/xylose/arabinose/galactoside ABC-type transport system permease subunit